MSQTIDIQPKPTPKVAPSQQAQNKQSQAQKMSKALIGAVIAVVVLVGGYFGYKYLIQVPNEEKAANALFAAERYYGVDSFNLVLNGDGQNQGALQVISKYKGTQAANLASYYAGMSFLKSGDAQNAIKYLSDFNGEGTLFGNLANGALGDAYMDAGQVDKGIEFYKKAAADKNDEFTAPLYTLRAGLACEKAGKLDEAKAFYLQIKNEFPTSMQANEIDKYLARLGEVTVE